MKLRYFTYHFENSDSDTKTRQPLNGILDAYCDYINPNFKNSFQHNDETIFLLKEKENQYIFAKTKDTELVKTINKRNIKIDEIKKRLKQDESIGFASHLYAGENFLAFGTTHLAPTISAFGIFINDLFAKLKIKKHRIAISPLTEQITRDEAINMKFIGETAIKVNRKSDIFEKISGVFGITEKELDDLHSFEITIKPVKRRDISKIAKKITRIPPSGIERFEIRAKAELYDRLADFRIEDSLVLHDFIPQNSSVDNFTLIEQSVLANDDLEVKVREYDKTNEIRNDRIRDIVKFHSISNWPPINSNT